MAFVDAREAGLRTDLPPLHLGGVGAAAYADAVATYLGMAVSKLSDAQSSLARWKPSMDQTIATFGRQALPMVWDYAESNAFAGMAGDFLVSLKNMMRVLGESAATTSGSIGIIDAAQNSFPVRPVVISTDPPYYDNIGYSDLSDFFYVWLKRALSPVWPDLFRRLIAPKAEELVATPYRHGGKSESEAFFMQGMSAALTAMKKASTDGEPLTIYYAFKQSEAGEDGVTSAGWASILQAVVDAGLAIDGTWPIRTELLNRMIGRDTNALASSIVLVCRKQIASADTAMRDEFLRSLQRELPEAISGLKKAGIAPVDMRQSIIGPGMGIFTRYKEVLEDSDRPMRVKAALAVISNVWNEISQQLDADLDVPTQLALEWYESFAFDRHSSSTLITSSGSADVSVNDLFSSGVFEDLKGNTRLTPRESLPDDWSPATDRTLTVWECVQHTARVLNADEGGAEAAAKLVAQMGSKAADARALAYRLFEIATQKGWTAEALVYNELAQEWPKLEGLAASDRSGSSKPTQRDMFVS